ncbi:MAG TPA: sulfatase-like hydrolase/transferase [Terriglobales bacterium]|nr:sulfatase-like hydrolase/transferase [Terriglobales bacterium]
MRATPRSLVLITVDCLRADRLGRGGQSPTMPFLDGLSKESFTFKNALASGIPTYYSLPALLASRYPLALGRDVIGLAPAENTIASELQQAGFRTAAFVAGNPYVCEAHGYGNGFDVFRNFLSAGEMDVPADQYLPQGRSLRGRTNRMISRACHRVPAFGAAYDELYFQYCKKVSAKSVESLDSLRKFPSAEVVINSAMAWLEQNSDGPFFLWIHLMDPHAPYYPQKDATHEIRGDSEEALRLNSFWAREDVSLRRLKTRSASVEALYDDGVRWADRQIGRLASSLADLNLWDQCALTVTADHGEEFLDHGGRFHPPLALHEELIRVPLLLRVPGRLPDREIKEPFGLIDLAPTLFDMLDLPSPASFRGHSCWRKLVTDESWDWPVLTECAYACTNPFRSEKRLAARILAVRKGEHKLVINFALGTDELYDLGSDPRESRPLPAEIAVEVRRNLLECARKHVAESRASRDLDLRLAAQTRELRAQWTQAEAIRPN